MKNETVISEKGDSPLSGLTCFMNDAISLFLQEQTCATICTVGEGNRPWCFSCFYEVNCAEGMMYFKSSPDAKHSRLMLENPHVAGTIQPDKLNKLMIRGLQFEAVVLDEMHPKALSAAAYYHKKNPLARMVPGMVWALQINHIKMTDNTRVFGKKISWNRE